MGLSPALFLVVYSTGRVALLLPVLVWCVCLLLAFFSHLCVVVVCRGNILPAYSVPAMPPLRISFLSCLLMSCSGQVIHGRESTCLLGVLHSSVPSFGSLDWCYGEISESDGGFVSWRSSFLVLVLGVCCFWPLGHPWGFGVGCVGCVVRKAAAGPFVYMPALFGHLSG